MGYGHIQARAAKALDKTEESLRDYEERVAELVATLEADVERLTDDLRDARQELWEALNNIQSQETELVRLTNENKRLQEASQDNRGYPGFGG